MARGTGSEHERLGALIGRWRTEGSTREGPGTPAARIDATDTYEWLPGGTALLHRVDARVGEARVEGAEIIGYVPERDYYATQYFGSDGPAAYEASIGEQDGALVWRMRSERDRFSGRFSDDGNTITGHWESLGDDSSWRPWMDITLTRQGGGPSGRLARGAVAARIPAQDLERARAFYADKLGLEPSEERPGGLLYRCGSGVFTVFQSSGEASGAHTQMAWEVDDIEATVAELRARGVVFEQYDFPGLETVDGIVAVEGNYPSKGGRGERAVWFRDSEGNLLGIGQSM